VGRIYSILAAAEDDGSFMLDIIDAAIVKTQATYSTSDTASATHRVRWSIVRPHSLNVSAAANP
jgi:hypothetical protein